MSGPRFPRTDRLLARALAAMLRGEKINHLVFQDETESYRLSSLIHQLRRRHGWTISTLSEHTQTIEEPRRRVTYTRYFIEPELLRELKGAHVKAFIKAVADWIAKRTKGSNPALADTTKRGENV
jgi:hypothetical protein